MNLSDRRYLVDTDWLQHHLDEPELRVVLELREDVAGQLLWGIGLAAVLEAVAGLPHVPFDELDDLFVELIDE